MVPDPLPLSTFSLTSGGGNRLLLGGGIIACLILLLVEKEVLRAMGDSHRQRWMQHLDLGIAPLLLAFAFNLILRLIELLR